MAFIVFRYQADLLTQSLAQASFSDEIEEYLTALRSVAKPKLLDSLLTPPVTGITESCFSLRRVTVQAFYIELLDVLVDDLHRLFLLMFLDVLWCQFPLVLFNLDVVSLTEDSASLRKVHVFLFHNKRDRITTFATYETVADVLSWTNRKRWVLVVVERTAAFPVGTFLLQRNILSNHIDYR